MNKIGAFYFITEVLPAFVVILFLSFLFKFDLAFGDKSNPSLLLLAIYLPLSMILGAAITKMGYWAESKLDKFFKLPHPIVEIFAKFPVVKSGLRQLFPTETFSDDSSDDMDALFEKGRILFYQKPYSSKAKDIMMMALFFRNLVSIAMILILGLWFKYLFFSYFGWSFTKIIAVSILFLFVGYLGRYFSQKLYQGWMYEILKNLEIYFLTEHKTEKNEKRKQKSLRK